MRQYLLNLCYSDVAELARAGRLKPAGVARLCGVCLRETERIIKARFHKTPRRWIAELQCYLAVRLMAKEGKSGKEASELSGFSSPQQMCHTFRRLFRATPRDYVRRHGGAGRRRSQQDAPRRAPARFKAPT